MTLPTHAAVQPLKPLVICLCGSTRFARIFNEIAVQLTIENKIVVRPEVVTYDSGLDPQHVDLQLKRQLDELHRRKIDLSDEVLVVNVHGYVGSSTREEIRYARRTGKPVRWYAPGAAVFHRLGSCKEDDGWYYYLADGVETDGPFADFSAAQEAWDRHFDKQRGII